MALDYCKCGHQLLSHRIKNLKLKECEYKLCLCKEFVSEEE